MANESKHHLQQHALQQLQALQRFGLTHIPRRPAREPDDSLADSLGVCADGSDVMGKHHTSATVQTQLEPVDPTQAGGEFLNDNQSVELSLTQRQSKLGELATCVASCTRCEELAETRTQTVFGVGDPQAKIVFVGEAPGADEDRKGEPFVGRAGQLLDRIIEACKLKREDVYICNILKCRPPGNRNPSGTEAANCREYLDGQLGVIDPEYIVCWGTVAAQNLLDTTTTIGKMRGKFYQHRSAKVLCTYHPSYLLRNPSAKKQVWEDMKFLFADMGVELD